MPHRNGHVRTAHLAGVLGMATVGLLVARHNATLIAQDPTPLLTKDVAPILSQNCTTCHRPGGLGPFSLMSYDSVKTYLDELRGAVPRAPCHRGTPRASTVRSRMTNGCMPSTRARSCAAVTAARRRETMR